mgnify:CR=1 FL=1
MKFNKIQLISGIAGVILSSQTFAGQVLGEPLGNSLGTSLPIGAGGILLVAMAGLSIGISIIKRKQK